MSTTSRYKDDIRWNQSTQAWKQKSAKTNALLQKYREKIEDIKDYRQKKKHYSYLTLHGEWPTDTSEGNTGGM